MPVLTGVESLKNWFRLRYFRANCFAITNFGIIKTFLFAIVLLCKHLSYSILAAAREEEIFMRLNYSRFKTS